MSNLSTGRIAACTGAVSVMTALALTVGAGPASATPDTDVVGPSLREASIGLDDGGNIPGVQCVQGALNVQVDGRYGQDTFDAVQAFQAENNLVVDGVVGPATGDLLVLALAADDGWDAGYDCYDYLPTTYALADPTNGTYSPGDPGEARAIGGSLSECTLGEAQGLAEDGVKILTGEVTAKRVKRFALRFGGPAFNTVKCIFVG